VPQVNRSEMPASAEEEGSIDPSNYDQNELEDNWIDG
jgi:hypothetical protein